MPFDLQLVVVLDVLVEFCWRRANACRAAQQALFFEEGRNLLSLALGMLSFFPGGLGLLLGSSELSFQLGH
jgi:hypothetical protein